MELWRITYGGRETPSVVMAGENLASVLLDFSKLVNHPTTITKAEKIEGRFIVQAREPLSALLEATVEGSVIGGAQGHYYEALRAFTDDNMGPGIWCIEWRDKTYYNGSVLRVYYAPVTNGGA